MAGIQQQNSLLFVHGPRTAFMALGERRRAQAQNLLRFYIQHVSIDDGADHAALSGLF
jgi:hypothetical protein